MKKQRDILSGIKIGEPKNARRIYLFVSVTAIIYWFASVLYEGMNSAQLYVFFHRLDNFMSDYLNVIGYSADENPYVVSSADITADRAYPPLNYLLFRILANPVDVNKYNNNGHYKAMRQDPLILILFVMIVSMVLIMVYTIIRSKANGSSLDKNLAAAVFVMSAPMWYAIDSGNIVLLAFLFSLVFVCYYNDENVIKKELALISLGIAFGLKLSPALFGVLLLFNKQYKEAARTAIYGLLFLFVPFLFIKGGFSNIPIFLENMKLMTEKYSTQSGCSLKWCFQYVGMPNAAEIFTGKARYLVCIYLAVCSVFCKRDWEKLAALGLIILFTPAFSHYYCLLYMMPAAIMFLNEKKYRKLDWIALISFMGMFVLHIPVLDISGIIPFYIKFNNKTAILVMLALMLFYGTVPMLIKCMEYRAAHGRPELLQSRGYLALTGGRIADKA